MEIEFLGTGTSNGVPEIRCKCQVCQSNDEHDKRLRSSVIVRTKGLNLLIDCGPDFRQQILRASNDKLDALLITHFHYDHIGGVEDLRLYCHNGKFSIYAQEAVLKDIRNRMPYCFVEHPYPGVPQFELNAIDIEPFKIGEVLVEPLLVMHYKLPILGFKIGDMAYITDAKTLPEETIEKIKGVDTLIINALRISEHMSHMSLSQALDVIKAVSPSKAYITHISHDMGFHEIVTNTLLPPNVELAYDGLIL